MNLAVLADEDDRRRQLIWQNFRIKDCTKANALVLGTDHPDYLEGKEAAAGNSQELFEQELIESGNKGVAVERLLTLHTHYFGGGFEKVVGTKLKAFLQEKFQVDDAKKMVKISTKLLDAIRMKEARSLLEEEKEYQRDLKRKVAEQKPYKKPEPIGMGGAPVDIFDPDKRPRYASTKMVPDECDERVGGGLLAGGKGGGMF